MDATELNISSETKSTAFVATATGAVVGAVAAWDKPGSSFVAVAGQVAVMTLVPVYFMNKDYTYLQTATANGALMAAVCYGFHSFGADSCAKYGILVGAVTYAALAFLHASPDTSHMRQSASSEA
jgi:hypothetical protein